ncbi:hypothetical protein D0T53_02335 [Dysgonomonas sp. 216]|uniref:fasciclin domain-containing protein n=1 Tax=Dysgonomonas sp. 216 TaxID=2302934 RepID=UPI0013D5D945|nr:fasciclin domain-containing protein [Dysgonomonas sp. 216]NDW17753.1 hypothetical protein [Dysgonomonas sp. 216]
MKIQVNYKYRSFILTLGFLLVSFLLPGCYDSDSVGDNLYTFTGETIGSFLETDPERYGEFDKVVKKAGLGDLLKTYNKYTCFAPTNEAMYAWYDSLGVTSIDFVPDSIVRYVAYSHLIPDKVYEFFTEAGALASTNMNSRYLVVGFRAQGETVNVVINSSSRIIDVIGLSDDEDDEDKVNIENGIIHVIDKVLTPSTAAIPSLLGKDSRLTIFSAALELTALEDSLQEIRDREYIPVKDPLSIDGKTICRSPKERKYGYTIFAESDEVLKNKANITDLEGLKTYAASVYDEMYPQDAGITDFTDRRNSLNRFVSYHIIDKTVHYNNFFYKANMAKNITLYEFMETFCPNTIFKASNDNGEVVLNSDIARGVLGVKVLPAESGREQDTDNGVYHLLDDILVYDRKVRTMLLNTRIRVDAASLHPELMTNGIRYEKGDNPAGVTGASNYYKFASGFLKNVEFISPSTDLYYLQGQKSGGSWNNYQADEMMATGEFDFIMRLPPVPAGTYEVRFGYTANVKRGILQFYIDGQPKGIPLNMKIAASDPSIGWVSDQNTLDEGYENDKMMRNRGYMKGGTSYLSGDNTARDNNGALRRIVSTETWTEDAPHYLRFKSVSGDKGDQFMIDYFELVPKNVYESPSGAPEDRI